MSYWTGRFESRHRIAKSTAESAKNVKNITKTIADRQQMRSASVYYNGMFNVTLFKLPEVMFYKRDIKDNTDFHNKLKNFMGDSDMICNNIFVNNQEYKNDDLIIIDITDCDNVEVGLIKTILVKENNVYFVIKRFKAIRNWLQYFVSEKPVDNICEFVESSNMADFKPLIKRGTEDAFIFVFHHHPSFEYQ